MNPHAVVNKATVPFSTIQNSGTKKMSRRLSKMLLLKSELKTQD
jgi:hypothetical protein